MSAERRQRPSAASARIASQPYPTTDQRIPAADPRIQTILAWVASLADAPQPHLGRLASNTVEAPPPPPPTTPPPPPPLPLPVEARYPGIPVLAATHDWVEPGTDVTDYRFQGALADALQLPLLPPADYSNLSRDVRMKEPWERSTITSTMHTVSMFDWNAEAERDAGSEFETMSDWTARPSRGIGEVLPLPVPAAPHQEKKEKEEEEGSDYAPSSRSVTPLPKAEPRPRRTPRNTTTTPRRTADLDEEYDGQDIDLDVAISGEPSEPRAKRRRYVSSGTTAVEDHSARSSPRESLSPSPRPAPPPPTRRKSALRGKVARRASFRPTVNFGSRDANGSESA